MANGTDEQANIDAASQAATATEASSRADEAIQDLIGGMPAEVKKAFLQSIATQLGIAGDVKDWTTGHAANILSQLANAWQQEVTLHGIHDWDQQQELESPTRVFPRARSVIGNWIDRLIQDYFGADNKDEIKQKLLNIAEAIPSQVGEAGGDILGTTGEMYGRGFSGIGEHVRGGIDIMGETVGGAASGLGTGAQALGSFAGELPGNIMQGVEDIRRLTNPLANLERWTQPPQIHPGPPQSQGMGVPPTAPGYIPGEGTIDAPVGASPHQVGAEAEIPIGFIRWIAERIRP